MLYGKINFKNANYHDIIFMPKANAPIHSYKKASIYYFAKNQLSKNIFGKSLLGNYARYGKSDRDSERPLILVFNSGKDIEIAKYFQHPVTFKFSFLFSFSDVAPLLQVK